MKRVATLAVSLGFAYGAACVGSFFTFGAIDTWYAALAKPELGPPNWVFGPVWTILYTLMAIAAWRIYEAKRTERAHMALRVYGVQLVLNIAWSIVFFGMHAPALGLVVILGLLSSIALSIKLFYPIDKTAAYLLVPYVLWVSFATYLNLMIVVLNS